MAGLPGAYGALGLAIAGVNKAFADNASQAKDVNLPVDQQVEDQTTRLANTIQHLKDEALTPLDAAQKANIITLKSYGQSLTDIAKDVGSNEVAVKLFLDANKAAEEQAKKNAEAMKKLATELDNLANHMKVTSGVSQALLDELDGLSKGAAADLETIMGSKAQQQAADLQEAFAKLTSLGMVPTEVELERVAQMAAKLFNEGATLSPQLLDLAANMGDLGVKATEGWPKMDELGTVIGKLTVDKVKPAKDALVELAHTFDALGSAMNAISPAIGAAITDFGHMTSAIDGAKKSFDAIGDAKSFLSNLSNLASGIGGIVTAAVDAGKAIDSLWNHFFGSAGRDAVVAFANTFQGGFDGLHQQLDQLGAEGEQLWINLTQGVGKNDPAAAQKAINDVNNALNTLHNTETSQILSLGNQITSLGGQISPALDPYIQKLVQMGILTQANADQLKAMEGDGTPTYATLTALQQKYNLTAAEMGPAFQAEQINDQFQTLINDLDTLTNGGVDLQNAMFTAGANGAQALTGLGTAIQGDIQQAINAGVAIPENLKAAAQSLIDQGDLLDANGKKITDINQLTFGETMQDSLDKLNDTLTTLIQTLSGSGPGSLTSALGDVNNIVVHPKIQPIFDGSQIPPNYGAPGGGSFGGAQAAGGDYFVTKPTWFLAGEAGPESASFSGAGNAGGSGAPRVLQPVIVQVGQRQLIQAVIDVAHATRAA